MHPDDEIREPDETPEEPVEDGAGEHELPPSTWAGRERAGAGEKPEPDEPESEAPEEPEAPAEPESPGFTEEFTELDRELDAELEGLDEAEEEPEPTPKEPEAEEPPSEETEPVPADPGATVEADSVPSDEPESAEEKALAGLRERAGAKWESETNLEKEAVAAGVAAAVGEADDDEGAGKPPKRKALWARFLVGSIMIVAAMAAATSISLLVYLTEFAEGLDDDNRLDNAKKYLEHVDGGDPQNILILGSDERLDLPGDRRSDTTILLRVDPEQQSISLLSIPRDLRVSIPNHGIDKFNAAYSYGGPDLTLRVVKQLTGLEINHLVNINFTGFADAVNAIDCVYIDVDRRYYIPAESEIAEIDIEAGYQRLCGFYALQYVRFRHDDNDLIRAARQQDFLREARQNVPPSKLIEDRTELIKIFTDHTTSDIDDPITLLELLKTFFEARNAELHEVHFPADLGDAGSIYVTASQDAIQETVETFMGTEGTPGPPETGESAEPAEDEKEGDGGGDGKGDKNEAPDPQAQDDGPTMDDATAQGEQYANQISKVKTRGGDPMVEFPIFYPTQLVPGSLIDSASRAFPIDGPGDDEYRGYKMVVGVPGESFGNGLLTEYYGISGTDWEDPPILANPSEPREIDGRTYDLYYDGDRLRLVAWHEKRGSSYWINNTLSQSLSEEQMLEIAVSMRQLDG